MTANINFDAIREAIEKTEGRSAWDRGVKAFAIDLVGDLEANLQYYDAPTCGADLEAIMLNGATSWKHYAWSGCGLCYDADIAEALCTPSELKRTRNGNRRPNASEEWLDVYGRAMAQAAVRVKRAYRNAIGYIG